MPATTDENKPNGLLHEQSSDEIGRWLVRVGFADSPVAEHCLRHIAVDPAVRPLLARCLPALMSALGNTANPDRALTNLQRFVHSVDDQPSLFRYLADNPRAVEVLITLFAGSQFLTEILLRHPTYFEQLVELKRLAQVKNLEQFGGEAYVALASCSGAEGQLDALRRFQRWELLRIGTCDLLGLLDMPTVTAQLSHLADSLVRVCLSIAAAQSGTKPDGFAVLAMGKLGGRELNYSSDIDLLFLARQDATAYLRLSERLIEALARVTSEGFLYRVDMRLRPWGSAGALVSSLEGHVAYLSRQARLWEKQALLKARVIAGDEDLGGDFLRRAEPLLFNLASDRVRADVHAMKQRTEAHLRQAGREWGEVKLGEGSIRDVEFVAQYLQLAHGAEHPEVRSRNTLDALARLAAGGFLSADEYRVLTEGYIFLRTIEHYLQMMDYRQTYTLPSDAEGLTHLAQRLGFQGLEAGDRLVARYQQHSSAIRAVYRRYLGADDMGKSTDSNLFTSTPPSDSDSGRHLERMGPSYVAVFGEEEIKRHAEMVGLLGDNHLVEVDAIPLKDGRWRVTVVGYDYLGELSLICGLLFVYGFNILDGDSFTYERVVSLPSEARPAFGRSGRRPRPRLATPDQDTRQKIVDVFTVRSVLGPVNADLWSRYASDLAALLRRLEAGEQREAQGELARRAALTLHKIHGAATPLYPIDIEIDNEIDERCTVLRIDAPDTIGFLYEFTNALALNGIYIARMTVGSVGSRVQDVFYVTDTRGQKITAPNRQRELRAATVLVKHFTHLLPQSPNPESALLHFSEFLGQLFMHPNWPDELTSLERQEVLEPLARLLGVSEFLWDDFLRMQHANLFPVVQDVDGLAAKKTKGQLRAELSAALQTAPDKEAQRAVLNAFKDREMFRVDMRHIQGHITRFGQFSGELADLAEVVVEATYRLCEEDLRAQFGEPRLADGQPSPLSLCALGKCGGRELGFASDIELMFIYAGNGQTTGPEVISTAESYERLVQDFIRTIQARREGIFQVDLQLRPYGQAGSMAVSLEAFSRYFAPNGPAWAYERQALIKLRPVAGDTGFGEKVMARRDELVYSGEPFDVAAMHAMRERQVRHLVAGGTINAKYSPGGLVDLEYLVQGLQITHGHRDPSLRLTNTREAMTALATAGILSPDDYTRLRDAHRFLRRLIDALRMVRGNAKDLTVPPAGSDEFAFLARRQGYGSETARLRDDLIRHTAFVQELSARLLG